MTRLLKLHLTPSGLTRRRITMSVFALLLSAVVLPLSAAATPITLSNASSDPLLLAASDMSAAISFSVVGSELTILITNDALGGAEPLSISEIYFNASSTVLGLALVSAPTATSGALLWEGLTGTGANGFGAFDFSLKSVRIGKGKNAEIGEVVAGETLSFIFSITGIGVDASDFGAELSTPGAGETAALGAAFFRGATNEAYGAQTLLTPEPSTALLLALGLVSLAATRRRGGLPA